MRDLLSTVVRSPLIHSQGNTVVLEKLLRWRLQALLEERDDELHELTGRFLCSLDMSVGARRQPGDVTHRDKLCREDDERRLEEPFAFETPSTVP